MLLASIATNLILTPRRLRRGRKATGARSRQHAGTTSVIFFLMVCAAGIGPAAAAIKLVGWFQVELREYRRDAFSEITNTTVSRRTSPLVKEPGAPRSRRAARPPPWPGRSVQSSWTARRALTATGTFQRLGPWCAKCPNRRYHLPGSRLRRVPRTDAGTDAQCPAPRFRAVGAPRAKPHLRKASLVYNISSDEQNLPRQCVRRALLRLVTAPRRSGMDNLVAAGTGWR